MKRPQHSANVTAVQQKEQNQPTQGELSPPTRTVTRPLGARGPQAPRAAARPERSRTSRPRRAAPEPPAPTREGEDGRCGPAPAPHAGGSRPRPASSRPPSPPSRRQVRHPRLPPSPPPAAASPAWWPPWCAPRRRPPLPHALPAALRGAVPPAGRGGVPAPERKDGRETEAAEEGAAMAAAALCLPSQCTTRRFGRPELPHIPIPFILILIPTFSSLRTESGVKVKAERGEERELRRFFSSDSALFFVVFPLPVPHHAAGRRHRVRELSLKYTFHDKGSDKVKK